MKERNYNLIERKGVNYGTQIVKKECDDCRGVFRKFNKEAFVIEGTRVVVCKTCWMKRLG